MYSFPNSEPVYCSMSGSKYCFFTYIQVSQEAGNTVRYSHLFKNFSTVCCDHTVKGFGIVNKAEIDVFSGLPCFSMIQQMLASWSLVPLPFLNSSLYIWKFLVHVLLKHSLKDSEHYLGSMWDECNCAVVWTFFGIVLLWDWNEKWPFPVLWPLLSFPNLLAYWVQHFSSVIFQDLK